MPNYRVAGSGTYVRATDGQSVFLPGGLLLPEYVTGAQLTEMVANGRVYDDTSEPHPATGGTSQADLAAAIAALVNDAPADSDTLGEIADLLANGTSVPVPVDPDDDDKVLTAQGGEYVLAAPTGGGAAPDYFIATLANGINLVAGTDYYPEVTVVASEGTSIALAGDDVTIEIAPGVYDISLVSKFAWASGTPSLNVYLDGAPGDLPTLRQDAGMPGLVLKSPDTIQGVVFDEASEIAFNFELIGGGTWQFSEAQVSIRRVADAPA